MSNVSDARRAIGATEETMSCGNCGRPRPSFKGKIGIVWCMLRRRAARDAFRMKEAL